MEKSRPGMLSLITGLDLIMVATGAASTSVALASAVASNEVAANGPDMDEKLSRLNARESAAVFRYYASFKALPGTRRDARALSSSFSSLLSSFYLSVSATIQIRSIIKRLIIGPIVRGGFNGRHS